MNDFEGKTALTTTSKHAELRYAPEPFDSLSRARHKEAHISPAQLQCNRGHKRTNVKRKKKYKWNQRMINAFLCSPWIIYHSQDDASVVMGMRQWYYMLTPTVDQTARKKTDFLWAFDGSLGFCCWRCCLHWHISHLASLSLWQRGPTRVIVTSTAATKDFLANWRPTKCARRIILCVISWQLLPSNDRWEDWKTRKKKPRTI